MEYKLCKRSDCNDIFCDFTEMEATKKCYRISNNLWIMLLIWRSQSHQQNTQTCVITSKFSPLWSFSDFGSHINDSVTRTFCLGHYEYIRVKVERLNVLGCVWWLIHILSYGCWAMAHKCCWEMCPLSASEFLASAWKYLTGLGWQIPVSTALCWRWAESSHFCFPVEFRSHRGKLCSDHFN